MGRRSSKKQSSRKTRFADWLRSQFEPSADPQLKARRLQFEYLEPRQMLSVAQANGPAIQVNTYTTNAQIQSKVASDTDVQRIGRRAHYRVPGSRSARRRQHGPR
jgi:hypothetical protein